jgi:hypothetical protein
MPKLFMHYLKCDKTTEAGEDEVYFVVGTRHSNGSVSTYRLPTPDKHWDMNDGNSSKSSIGGFDIAQFDLEPGEHIDLLFNLNEEDGGVADNYMNQVGNLLVATEDPYAASAGIFVKVLAALFDFKDSDDWMGSFMVRIRRGREGQYSADWKTIDRIFVMDPAGKGQFYRAICFRGDGSDYTAHFEVQGL